MVHGTHPTLATLGYFFLHFGHEYKFRVKKDFSNNRGVIFLKHQRQ